MPAPQEPFEAMLVHRRINRWMLGLCVLPALGGIAELFATASRGFHNLGGVLVWFAMSVAGFLVVLGRRPVPSAIPQNVRVDSAALHLGDEVIARATLRSAEVFPAHDGAFFVRVSRRGRLATDLGVGDRQEGRRLLRALGFDASQSVAHFWSRSRAVGQTVFRGGLAFIVAPVVLGVMALLLESAPWMLGVGFKTIALLVVAGAVALAIPARIDVGADGVLLRWLGTRRFIPLAHIRSLERTTEGIGKSRQVGVRLRLEDGDTVWLPMGDARWADERAGALLERIQEAMDTQAHGPVTATAALLGRRERGAREWIRELRALGAGANADLRTAPVEPEQLWRIVESHGAAPEERAAAAIALSPSLDPRGKERLGVAVDAVADERLRVAIDAAVKEDDAALEEALDEMSGFPRGERASSPSAD